VAGPCIYRPRARPRRSCSCGRARLQLRSHVGDKRERAGSLAMRRNSCISSACCAPARSLLTSSLPSVSLIKPRRRSETGPDLPAAFLEYRCELNCLSVNSTRISWSIRRRIDFLLAGAQIPLRELPHVNDPADCPIWADPREAFGDAILGVRSSRSISTPEIKANAGPLGQAGTMTGTSAPITLSLLRALSCRASSLSRTNRHASSSPAPWRE